MSHLHRQGQLFVGLAVLALLACVLLGRPGADTELLLAAGLILVLGVPHGALDLSYARSVLGARTLTGWASFAAAYLSVAAVVVWFWMSSPLLFLAAFLLVSAAHFSADPVSGTGWIVRVLYGGAVVTLPVLLHGAEVQALFAMLIGEGGAEVLRRALGWLAVPWLCGVALVLLPLWQRDRATAAELAALALLATVAPPLLAFTLYFCAMHSPRHVLRTGSYFRQSPRRLLATALIPMAGVLVLLTLLWPRLAGLTGSSALGVNLVTLLFVGLAALTVPHMLLVERVRFTAKSAIW